MTNVHARTNGRGPAATPLSLLIGTLGLIATVAPASAVQCPPQPYVRDVPQPASVEFREPANIGETKRQALNYLCFDQYDKDVASVLAAAKDYVETYVTLMGDKIKDAKLALVLDIDETSLSNRPVLLADDFGYIKGDTCDLSKEEGCGWPAWFELAEDKPIPPTLELFNLAKAKGIKVFFVTGRCEIGDARAKTEKNLHDVGYVEFEKMFMLQTINGKCPHPDTIVEFKEPTRAGIEAEGYSIIANVGDQWSDLSGGHAQMTFKVPNPFYFLP